GIWILAMAIFHSRTMTLVCAAGIGASVAVVTVASTALLQGETPPELRGRVSSSSTALVAMAQAAAMVVAGASAARFGIIRLFLASAAMLVVVGLAGIWRLRRTSEASAGTSAYTVASSSHVTS